jgi:ATP-dependent RNA helicase RhlE
MARAHERYDVTQFSDLGLAPAMLKALAAKGYDAPSPIQIQAIPPVLEGRDLIGLAQTGTGKTAAFALPILQRLNAAQGRKPGRGACRTLVLAPTRELAAQIGESFRAYGKFTGLTTAVVFGGVSIGKQIQALARGVDVLVATPGRLLDLIAQQACRLDAVEILVLDEADHMMDMGFIVPLKKIAALLPKRRQTLFFSATMPEPIEALAAQFITEAVRVAVTPVSSTAQRVRQCVIHIEATRKQALLHDLLKDRAIARALVFARTKHGANRVVQRLEAAGVEAAAIHGNKSQAQRERALGQFKRGEARLLVATEIAARGIDVDQVTHVINFDLPDVPEQYVHRIGRTARAGAEGVAISFCAPEERGNLRDIEKLIGQGVPVMRHDLGVAPPERREHGPHAHKGSAHKSSAHKGRGGSHRGPKRPGQQSDRQGAQPQRPPRRRRAR